MGFFIDERKVQAAATSMHQFYAVVRGLFDPDVSNRVVEAATTFLYLRLATDVFGRRFVDKMGPWMPDRLKYSSAKEIKSNVERLSTEYDRFVGGEDDMLDCFSYESEYAHHIRSVIKALYTVAEMPMDAELVRDAFVPMEQLLTLMGEHLLGIKNQNAFLMRS